MSDPADKSDDLIAELAKLMAAPTAGSKPAVQPMARPVPIDPLATAPSVPSPMPIRIPGMDTPRPAAAAPQPEARAPVTGAIRIPGMDQPAQVSTSAPVSKFDFGKPIASATPIRQEPISSLAERLAAQNPSAPSRVEPNFGLNAQPAPQPVRVPSDLRPISENRSFAQGPALSVAPPAPAPVAPPQPAPTPATNGNSDFSFDFGFGRNPPASASPPRPTPANDPIADLIAADMADAPQETPAPIAQREAPRPTPVQMTPVVRTAVTPQPAVTKPTIAPISAAAPRSANSAPIPLKPVSVAPRTAENDRFAISPGVGLNMKPMASQPLNTPTPRAPEPAPKPAMDESDPMSEIENLIGEAVRVELSAPGPVRVQAAPAQAVPQVAAHVQFESEEDLEEEIGHKTQPSAAPVVPPLNTQFAPRRAGLKDDASHSAAEDAILAAAAATGAQVDRIEPAVGDESPYRRLKVKPARSSFISGGMRQYVGMAVAGTLLLAAGLGLYWVLNMGRTANVNTAASAPQLTADATPVKEVPKVPAAADSDAARSPVLEQMAGTSAAPSAEQLVSTDETNGGAVARDVTAPASDDTEGGLANRKVRTVTVRPDGTIVSGDDAVAGAEELPVDRPNVPSVPSTETTNLLGDNTQVAMTDPVADNTALTAAVTPETPLGTTAETTELQPVFDPTIVAPKPLAFPARSDTQVTAFVEEPAPAVTAEVTGATTPAGQIDLLGGGDTQVAAVEPKPVRASNAAAYVQLSSSPSEADAKSSLRGLNSRFGSLFGGNELIVQSADLGQKGTWYRVKLPAASVAEAQRICSQIKSSGGDCIVSGG